MEEFKKLYKLYGEKIYKYMLYLTKNEHIAEELLQETFLRAMKNIDKFNGRSFVSTWLFGISKNIYLEYIRGKKKNEHLDIQTQMNFLKSEDTVHFNIIENEKLKEIFESIDKLEEPYKEVIVLRGLNNLSYKEIAEIMGRKESWVRVIVHRGRLKLKDIIAQQEKGGR